MRQQRPPKCYNTYLGKTPLSVYWSVIHSTTLHTQWSNLTGVCGHTRVHFIELDHTGTMLLLFFLFSRWAAMLTIYTCVLPHKVLQSIFLAGVKELWLFFWVFFTVCLNMAVSPVNLLLLFSVSYESKLNTFGFCTVGQPKQAI